MQPSPTNQHYVPQFLLRGFASGRSKQIFVFEKATEQTFRTATRNVAAGNGFYDFEVNSERRSIDPLLGILETPSKIIIQTILNERSLISLDEHQRHILSLFVVAQLLRTDASRKRYKDLGEKIAQSIIAHGGDPNQVEGFRPLSDEEAPVTGIGGTTHTLQGLDSASGVTWDGSGFWVTQFNATGSAIVRFSPTGVPTGQSFVPFVNGVPGGVAFDSSDNTLWIGTWGEIHHFTTDGVNLGSFTIADSRFAGGLGFEPAEVPEPSTLSLVFFPAIAGTAIMGVIRRRKRLQRCK